MLYDPKKMLFLEVRSEILSLMAVCLRMHERTQKEQWMNDYKWFEEQIKIFA